MLAKAAKTSLLPKPWPTSLDVPPAGPLAPTSSVGVGAVGETPDIAQAHAVANAGQQEVQLAGPVAPVCGEIHVQVYIALVTGGHQQVWGNGLPVKETKEVRPGWNCDTAHSTPKIRR